MIMIFDENYRDGEIATENYDSQADTIILSSTDSEDESDNEHSEHYDYRNDILVINIDADEVDKSNLN